MKNQINKTSLSYHDKGRTLVLVSLKELHDNKLRRVGKKSIQVHQQVHVFTYVTPQQRSKLRLKRKGKGVVSGVYSRDKEGVVHRVLAYPQGSGEETKEDSVSGTIKRLESRIEELKRLRNTDPRALTERVDNEIRLIYDQIYQIETRRSYAINAETRRQQNVQSHKEYKRTLKEQQPGETSTYSTPNEHRDTIREKLAIQLKRDLSWAAEKASALAYKEANEKAIKEMRDVYNRQADVNNRPNKRNQDGSFKSK